VDIPVTQFAFLLVKEMKEVLINNYVHWIKTTTNQEHKQYAKRMLDAVYTNDQGKVFKEYGKNY
jgi:hypothetical protein